MRAHKKQDERSRAQGCAGQGDEETRSALHRDTGEQPEELMTLVERSRTLNRDAAHNDGQNPDRHSNGRGPEKIFASEEYEQP